jgi:arylsulfatase A-like enzyme
VPGTPALSSNHPLRGEKAQLYEGGIRVPAFVHWQGTLAPRTVAAPMHVADWMPTLTRLIGWEQPSDVRFDGQDMWPAITGAIEKPSPRTIYIPLRNQWAVLHDGWKLIVRDRGTAGLDDEDANELYHVFEDPGETTDLSARQPQRVHELRTVLADLRRGDRDELPADLRGIKD